MEVGSKRQSKTRRNSSVREARTESRFLKTRETGQFGQRAGDRGHGGSAWKRWPNKRDHKNGDNKNRMTVRADGTIRDHGKTKTRSGTRKRK